MATSSFSRRHNQRGTVLPVILIAGAAVAAGLSTFAGRTLSEQSRLNEQVHQLQSSWRARGEIEFAKCQILNSTYTAGVNDVLTDALADSPPLIPGTSVMVEQAGPERWYRLTDIQETNGVRGICQTFVRDGLYYTAYNYYVEDNDLGISGRPHGRVHTNGKLQIHFPGAIFDGPVSAVEGFLYRLGGSEEATTFHDGAHPSADPKTLLDDLDLSALMAEADWSAPAGFTAMVYLEGDEVRFDLYTKGQTVLYPRVELVKVAGPPEYLLVKKTVYEKVSKQVAVQVKRTVWVPPTQGSGSETASGATGGYFRTIVETEIETQLVDVPVGETEEWEWVETFTEELQTVYREEFVPGELVDSQILPANGVYAVPDRILSLQGTLDGKLSLITDDTVAITGSIQYVDAAGETAYLNGEDPELPYQVNPRFQRDHSLAVIARSNIVYAVDGPDALEVNGCLVAAEGRIAFAGIRVSPKGAMTCNGEPVVKASLRRFGSLLSARRPASTLLDTEGAVETGYREGVTVFDRHLATHPPPACPVEQTAMVYPVQQIGGFDHVSAGGGVRGPGMQDLVGLASYDQIWTQSRGREFDWQVNDTMSPAVVTRTEATDPAALDAYDASGSGRTMPVGIDP